MSCVVAGSSNKSQPTTSTVQCLSNGSSALDSFTHPLFPTNRPVSTSPQGHTPISQDGSIAPVYILLWTNGYLLGGFRLTHDPSIMPMLRISFSISYSSANLALRSLRIALVSLPCLVLAAICLARPAVVILPRDHPPWCLHLVLPLIAGLRHCCLVRFDLALHLVQATRPPRVV